VCNEDNIGPVPVFLRNLRLNLLMQVKYYKNFMLKLLHVYQELKTF